MVYIYVLKGLVQQFTTKDFEAKYMFMCMDVYDIHWYWMFMVEMALIVYCDSDILNYETLHHSITSKELLYDMDYFSSYNATYAFTLIRTKTWEWLISMGRASSLIPAQYYSMEHLAALIAFLKHPSYHITGSICTSVSSRYNSKATNFQDDIGINHKIQSNR
ncbi:hypothetical protein BDB01DRAFT_894877 [Pilobolus umbonatus]|nr:hypothetical protein BDB01DRAFT_894877 [Pilobolus umbonatus]